MRADSLEQLLSYELPIERAIVYVLTAAGVNAFRTRDAARAQTPYVTVKILNAGATSHRGQYVPGKFTIDAWAGSFLLSVHTNRADPAQAALGAPAMGAAVNADHGADMHALLLGKVRVAMLYASGLLTDTNPHLAFHYIQQMEEAGGAPRVDENTDLDISPLVYKATWGIRGTAWPLPPAP